MPASPSHSWWRRLLKRWLPPPKGSPTWGDRAPTILGVCQKCGAAVLEGWHQEVPEGYLCRRCAAGEKGGELGGPGS